MLRNEFPTRVVNVRYTVAGLHFDAAIDCNWELHCYDESPEEMSKKVPIELYCFDHTEWDIRMMYQDLSNDQPKHGQNYMYHTEVNWEGIIEETKKWIEEELGQISKPVKPEKNEEDVMPLF